MISDLELKGDTMKNFQSAFHLKACPTALGWVRVHISPHVGEHSLESYWARHPSHAHLAALFASAAKQAGKAVSALHWSPCCIPVSQAGERASVVIFSAELQEGPEISTPRMGQGTWKRLLHIKCSSIYWKQLHANQQLLGNSGVLFAPAKSMLRCPCCMTSCRWGVESCLRTFFGLAFGLAESWGSMLQTKVDPSGGSRLYQELLLTPLAKTLHTVSVTLGAEQPHVTGPCPRSWGWNSLCPELGKAGNRRGPAATQLSVSAFLLQSQLLTCSASPQDTAQWHISFIARLCSWYKT